MITIFSIPKPFRGHTATIQRNAIHSWTMMHPKCEVILFGDEVGISEAATEMNVRHIPAIISNEYGTPLLSDSFKQISAISSNEILCYINCDIILFDDFMEAVIQSNKGKQNFLMVGQRIDLDLDHPIEFNENWEKCIEELVNEKGQLHPRCGIDYFVFRRGTIKDIPPFAVGRPGWDNWMIYNARNLGYMIIDASKAVTAIHQNHDYNHIPGRRGPKFQGPEGDRNIELVGGSSHGLTIDDANYVITGRYIRPAILRRIRKPINLALRSITNSISKYLISHKD